MIQNNFNNCNNVNVTINIHVNGEQQKEPAVSSPATQSLGGSSVLLIDLLCLIGIGVVKGLYFIGAKAVPFIAKDVIVPILIEGVVPATKWLGKGTLKGIVKTAQVVQQYQIEAKKETKLLPPAPQELIKITLQDGTEIYQPYQ